MAEIVTRFAPSPTGFLHIGGARTALFNWLFARRHGGRFVLRIEDTDRARSTPEATAAILDGMAWLGLDWDGEAVSQFARRDRHAAAAEAMIAAGTAYRCWATQDEIEAQRAEAEAAGRSTIFRSPFREGGQGQGPSVVRLRAPQEGETVVEDAVQGRVAWKNDTLDDLVLLRSDGTPTYMLAVVVDDHDMGVTHVIRGDDHLTNAARQTLIFQALGWAPPVFAHIPLIHGADGAKLSKRHGALGVEAYRDMGYLPAAMRNYLARLGWSHGDDELFTTEQAAAWFDLAGIGKAPARLDFDKLDNVSAHHLRATPDADLLDALARWAAASAAPLTDTQRARLLAAMPALKERAKKLPDLLEAGHFAMVERPIQPDDKAATQLGSVSNGILSALTSALQHAAWDRTTLEAELRGVAEAQGLKLGKLMAPARAALTGRTTSPSVFDMLLALGRDEALGRLADARTD